LSFLRQQPDGSTSLNILVPPSKRVMEKEKIVPLGVTVGKLAQGTGSIQGFKEERKNQTKIGKSLYYGPFTSHAPAYDSYFATLNAEEANLMLSAYGSETGITYADSLKQFCGESQFCLNLAHQVLDSLTGGAHSDVRMAVRVGDDGLTSVSVESRHAAASASADDEQTAGSVDQTPTPNYDINSLRTLTDVGIDVSFLDELGKWFLNIRAFRQNRMSRIKRDVSQLMHMSK
jgi:bromodomain-containing protein 7/9